MSKECLKLTCYFGERQREGKRFLADALLESYERHQLAASIMLRGTEGFGLKHHLRSDRSLTLSEDLPAMTVAVDSPPRIESLLEEVTKLDGIGLMTLERGRLMRGEVAAGSTIADDDALKLTIYLGRRERAERVPSYMAICDVMHRHGLSGATVLLGVDGTTNGIRHRAELFGRNVNVPTMVIAIGTGDHINRALPELNALIRDSLISVERVRICKRDGEQFQRPHPMRGHDEHGMALWQKISVFTSETAQYDGQPIHRAVTRRLREAGASGATSLRGIWGFSGDHQPHGDRFMRIVRHVPTLTIAVDSPERTAETFAVIDEVTRDRGLVISEIVPALRARSSEVERGGLRLAQP